MARFDLGRRRRRSVGEGSLPSAGGATAARPRQPLLPWRLAAVLAALASAVVGMLLTTGLVTISWVEVPDVGFLAALGLGVRLWLLAHGAGLGLGGGVVTIVPLGLTAICALAAWGGARFAAGQARVALGERPGRVQARSLALRVGGLFAAVYLVCVMVPSFVVSTASQSGHAFLGALALGLLCGITGSASVLGWNPTEDLPGWARPIPRAVGGALAVMLATGLAVAVSALVMNWSRVVELHRSLQPSVGGAVTLVVLQLLWLPNFVLWCASWALGAGISLGMGTVVSPAQNLTGLLPALPVFGAVPANGPGPRLALLWLLSGLAAGAVAAWVVVRARRAARFDETALVGALSGVLTGGALWLLARASNGDLGSTRLVGMGARLLELGVMAPTVMGISGLVTGLVLGLLRRPSLAGEADAADSSEVDDEATMALDDLDGLVHREDDPA